MWNDNGKIYDVVQNRFVQIPSGALARLDAEEKALPSIGEIQDALRSSLRHFKASIVDGDTEPVKDTVHKRGTSVQWARTLNELEDELKQKGAVELAPDLELPRGAPRACFVSENGIGAIRMIAYPIWDEANWDAAYIEISFTAIITKQLAN